MKTKEAIFDALISEELGMLRSAAYRVLGDPAEVDEVVQDALVKAWNKFDQFHGEAKLSSWVYRITVNLSCDRIRKRKHEAAKLKAYAENTSAVQSHENRALDILAEAIAELPELYRDAVLIGVLGEFSAGDAANLLNCSTNTMYQRIHKAKQLLREKMEVSA